MLTVGLGGVEILIGVSISGHASLGAVIGAAPPPHNDCQGLRFIVGIHIPDHHCTECVTARIRCNMVWDIFQVVCSDVCSTKRYS